MLPPKFNLRPKTASTAPVFEDRSGARQRVAGLVLLICLVVVMLWAGVFGLLMTFDQPQPDGHPTRLAQNEGTPTLGHKPPYVLPPLAKTSAVREKQHTHLATENPAPEGPVTNRMPHLVSVPSSPCSQPRQAAGSALAAFQPGGGPRVYALMPNEPVHSFLSLKRHCAQIDVLVPEWFEIHGPNFAFGKIPLDDEMTEVTDAIFADRASAPLVMPMVDLAYDIVPAKFVARLGAMDYRDGLIRKIAEAAEASRSVGICLRLTGMRARHDASLAPFLSALRSELALSGRALCLVTPVEDELWRSPKVTDNVDQLIVMMFQEPWLGSLPGPLASEPWFEATVAEIARQVGKDRLTVALGSFAVDWVTGKAVPETVSFAEAMSRLSQHGASLQFAQGSRNSTAAYVDASGNRHSLWMLDAVSTNNSLRILERMGIQNIAIATMGSEDGGLWTLLDKDRTEPTEKRLQTVALPDYVAYSGNGPFYRMADKGKTGARTLTVDPLTGMIVAQEYQALPRPFRMERYGAGKANQVAITFDDGPSAGATDQILDALRDAGAQATFFVVGRPALLAPDLLRRAVDEGHLLGLHTFFHPHMEDVLPFRAKTEVNAVRNLVEGVTGVSPRLYRPPYVRGPGPIDSDVAATFEPITSEGYIVAGMEIVPPDWTGISADMIVNDVLTEIDQQGGNVIVLHDGRSDGMHTAEAVRKLIPALRARGYEIVSLAALLGTSNAALMPPAEKISAAFNGASFLTIGGLLWFLVGLFWLALIASFVRALVFLALASRREAAAPRALRALPSVTVVIPAYNEEVVILQSVVTALESDYPNLQVIVVDNGSTDATARLVSKHFGMHPQVTLILQPNQGKWRALNAAISIINTEIVVCLDADTRIAPDAIFHLVQPFHDWHVGAVAGTVVVANRINLLTRMQAVEYITAQQIGRRAHEYLDGILVVPGALGAWRVDALRDLEGYSNETLTEDADLTLLMRRAGYSIAYAEDAISYTEAPADARSFLKQRRRWSLGNLQSLWKHRGAFGEWGPRKLLSMVDMIVFGYLLPLVSPVLDMIFLWFLYSFGSAWLEGSTDEVAHLPPYALFVFAAIPLVDLFVAWRALRYDGRQSMRLLLVVPLMNFVHRPLIYFAVYSAMWSAVSGRLVGWNKLRRQGGMMSKTKAQA